MSRFRRTLLVAAVGIAASFLAGCGVPNDREPTDIEPAATAERP
jgi:hypothetical protein